MNIITSLLIEALAVVLVFAAGYETGKTAERERMNAIVTQEQIKHEKQLSTAADTIVAASREYDALKLSRDDLLARLRQQVRSGGKNDSARTCEARAASLARMVDELSGLVEKCDAGWHGCASRKDALTEAVK